MLRRLLKNKAFSLLELIVAVSVFSIGITTVLEAFSFSAKLTKLSLEMNRATFLAQDFMQEWVNKDISNALADNFQERSGRQGIFTWAYRYSSYQQFPGHYFFDLLISWESLRKDQQLNLYTYLN